MSLQRIAVICCGMFAMMILMLLQQKKYPSVQKWKMVILSVLLTITGVLGTMIMYFIETGRFGGTSFFGAVLLVPILMLPAVLLKVPYKTILDLCAPAECLMLAIMKIDCLINKCCEGRYLPSLKIVFPSQIVESIMGLVVMAALISIGNKNKKTHLYAHYLIIYGASRFALNWFRFGLKPFLLGLPNGNFWGLVSVMIGLVWLALAKHKKAAPSPKA